MRLYSNAYNYAIYTLNCCEVYPKLVSLHTLSTKQKYIITVRIPKLLLKW